MRCPRLSELPTPPPGKAGWPWTQESLRLPDFMPSGTLWPKISVVTPNYNYGRFLEETIRSVLLQGYPNLEYVVIDGASTDGSVDVIRKYEKWISRWVSEKDGGQSDAINKGLSMTTGDLLNWINSDDGYLPGAFFAVGSRFLEGDKRLFVSPVLMLHPDGHTEVTPASSKYRLESLLFREQMIAQPGVFIPRATFWELGPFDETLHFSFDHDFFSKYFAREEDCVLVPTATAFYRLHADSKTMEQRLEFQLDNAKILRRFACRFPGPRGNAFIKKAAEFEANYVMQKAFQIWHSRGRMGALIYCARAILRNPSLGGRRSVVSATARVCFGSA